MKKFFIPITLTLLLGYSCRLVKDHGTAQQRDFTSENTKSFLHEEDYDSTDLYWFFRTDSPFYYHPLYGLYGRGGLLSVAEGHVQHHISQQTEDSVIYHIAEESQTNYSSKQISPRSYLWGLLFIGVVFGLVGLRAFR
ncbi:MAG TPA: hypothetical protein PKA53_07055 [Sphingobacterium sp.]|nr:hypothetical protein [Sphingobacterium sp.]